ncbi:MAG: hypothetical protein N4A44_01545 [Alphaproteobacteria bacterium]|jgi:hypothetical protein|nr:hypothetical protein [Alphaproteobacteria bacterium]
MFFLGFATTLIILLIIFWSMFSVRYIDSIQGFQGLSSLGIFEFSGLIETIVFPAILMLIVLALCYVAYLAFRVKGGIESFQNLTERNQTYFANVIRNLNESNQSVVSSNFFKILDYVFDDMAEKILQILKKSELVNSMAIKAEMEKGSEKYISKACRIFLAIEDGNPNFWETIRKNVKKDEALLEMVLDFLDSYENLQKALKDRGGDILLQDFVSKGPLGKVVAILNKVKISV